MPRGCRSQRRPLPGTAGLASRTGQTLAGSAQQPKVVGQGGEGYLHEQVLALGVLEGAQLRPHLLRVRRLHLDLVAPGPLLQHLQEVRLREVPGVRSEGGEPVQEDDGVVLGDEVLRGGRPPGAGAEVVDEPDLVLLEGHGRAARGDERDPARRVLLRVAQAEGGQLGLQLGEVLRLRRVLQELLPLHVVRQLFAYGNVVRLRQAGLGIKVRSRQDAARIRLCVCGAIVMEWKRTFHSGIHFAPAHPGQDRSKTITIVMTSRTVCPDSPAIWRLLKEQSLNGDR